LQSRAVAARVSMRFRAFGVHSSLPGTKIIISLQRGHRFPRSRRQMKALSVCDVAALHLSLKSVNGMGLGKWVWSPVSGFILPGLRVVWWPVVGGSAAAGRAACVVIFVFVMVIALRVVGVRCVDDLQGTESFKTPFRSVSESPALESYDIFRDFESFWRLSLIGLSKC